MADLTQKYLKTVLDYDPETGCFIRLVTTAKNVKIGDIAGCLSPIGYRMIGIDGRLYYAHRLTFLYMTGRFPKDHIDHINQKKNDNRWVNLRECTPSQNQANVGLPRNNTSGFKGVCWHKGSNKWMARIIIKRKSLHLGIFKSKGDAARAYNAKALELFGGFAQLNKVEENEK